MKQPRIISKISQSFVNPAYYKVYLKESVVKAILFIMFISILFSIPNMILMTIEAKQSVTVFENIINSEDFPGFVYENGELNSLSGESFLYEIGNSVVMFDTVGDYSIADLSKYEIGFLLDKTYMSLYSFGIEKTQI
ncbi:MAG: DUF1189 family protein, partial [Vallitaleaceae bacterium]|nr:DUF1189 family protein [Vallitaleaceae bacterium]